MRGSPGRFVVAAVALFAAAGAPFRAALAAPGCKPESVPKMAEPETKRLQDLFKSMDPDADLPIAFYVVDINNDGKSEIVGTAFGGSMGVLELSIFVERNGKIEIQPDIPEPRELRGGEGSWYGFQGTGPSLLMKFCDKTVVSLAGREDGALDGFVWKGGKTTRTCEPDWTGYQMSVFKEAYDGKLFERAKGVLRGYLRTCGARLKPATRLSILSDLAVTSFRLGDYADCLASVKQAKKVPGFDASKTKAALLFNESSCANPPPDASKADYRWLLDPKKLGRAGAGEPMYEALLAATVPPLDFDKAQLDLRVRGWLAAGLGVPPGRAVQALSVLDLRGMIRDRQTLAGTESDDGRKVAGNRYVTFWGCLPHGCQDRSMMWVDVDAGTSAFAANDFHGCFVVGSRTLDPADLPAAFKDALADWKKDKQALAHDCTLFVDGRKRTVNIVPLN